MGSNDRGEALSKERKAMAELSRDIRALDGMKLAELQQTYRRLFQAESHSKNTAYLRKKLAFRIQELAEGGLTEETKAQLEALMPAQIPLAGEQASSKRGPRASRPTKHAKRPAPLPSRDPRLPAIGTTIQREYQGANHEVQVLDKGFLHQATFHRSLSSVARAITGTAWNGFLFFGLVSRKG